MSKNLSLKLKDEIFNEVEEITKQFQLHRNAYINDALAFYNRIQKRRLLKEKLHYESELVKHSSLEILEEFERIEDEIIE